MSEGRLPAINGRQVIRALLKAGFVVDRIVGSHHVLTHPIDARKTVSVPVHAGREISSEERCDQSFGKPALP
jgi:predicted RNA binding protein YcfA (HicA-like mRNA interferase family)